MSLVWRYLRRYGWYCLTAVLLVVVEANCELLLPALMARMIDEGVRLGPAGPDSGAGAGDGGRGSGGHCVRAGAQPLLRHGLPSGLARTSAGACLPSASGSPRAAWTAWAAAHW